jgi:hypothetical protein
LNFALISDRTGQEEQDSQNTTVKIGQLERDCHDRTSRRKKTGRTETSRIEQEKHGRQKRIC